MSVHPRSLFRKCSRSDQDFYRNQLDQFNGQVNVLIRHQQGLHGNFLTRNIPTLLDIRNRFKFSGKIPTRLEIINAISRIFDSTIINPLAKRIGLHDSASCQTKQQMEKLIQAPSSKKTVSSGPLTSDQITKIKRKISGNTAEERLIKTTKAVTKEILKLNLPGQQKLSALKDLIELQTDSHRKKFFLENLDTLIGHIQSKTPIKEFLLLLNAYSITPDLFQKIRDNVNNFSNSSLGRTILSIQYLVKAMASSNISYRQEILHALGLKYQKLLLTYFESHLTYLLDLIISDESHRPNSLDLYFLSTDQIQEIRATINNQNIRKDLLKKLTAIDHFIKIIEKNPRLPNVKKEIVKLLHIRETQLQELYQLNQLIHLTLFGSPIEDSFLSQYQLTQEQIENIRKNSLKKGPSLREKQIYVMESLRDKILESSIETRLKDPLIKKLNLKIAILKGKPLNYQEELQSLIDLITKDESKFSDDDKRLSGELSRKYGFHPKNIPDLRKLLGITKHPLELDQPALDRIISIVTDNRVIIRELQTFLSRYGISPDELQSIRFGLSVRHYFSRIDPRNRSLEYHQLGYTPDAIRSIEENLSKDPVTIITKRLIKNYSLRKLLGITKHPLELTQPALDYLISMIRNNDAITGELKTLLSRYGISAERIKSIRNDLIATSFFSQMDCPDRLLEYHRLGYTQDAIRSIEENLSKDPATVITEHLNKTVSFKMKQNHQYLKASLNDFIMRGTLSHPDKVEALHVLRQIL